ncbi:C6 zinc finger domain protein [Ilyonectria robusta]
MFGTLSYDRDGQEPVFEADTTFPHSMSRTEPSRHVTQIRKACELCRARKLRCSADPTGCDRCKASSYKCKYPPRSFRTGRKRPLTSRSSATAESDASPSVDSATSIHNGSSRGGEFGQLDWQSASSSVGIDEEIASLSTHELLETSNGLGFQLSDVLPSIDFLLDNSTEYDFSDLFKVPWKDNQEVRTKTTKSLSKQPDISPRCE